MNRIVATATLLMFLMSPAVMAIEYHPFAKTDYAMDDGGQNKPILIKDREANKLEQHGSEYSQCYYDGMMSAETYYSGSGWFAGGMLGGLTLGLIGTGIAAAMSRGDVMPPEAFSIDDADCRMAFIQGYSAKAKGKKTTNAVLGGLVGTALLVGLAVAVAGS